jgi:TonB family protein
MRRCCYVLCPFLAALFISLCVLAQAQPQSRPTVGPPSTALSSGPDYPDSAVGLEHLVKDILKAQRENQAVRADALLRSFVLPSPREWYPQVFGKRAAAVASYYERVAPAIAPHLAQALLELDNANVSEIHAFRFESSCDDGASVDAFGTLLLRVQPVPLYELRFVKGENSARIFPIAYVAGAFRFVLPPTLQIPEPPRKHKVSAKMNSPLSQTSDESALVRVDWKTQEAKLIHHVSPVYPGVAMAENLQGEVVLQVVLNKDGSVGEIRDVEGSCSLAKSAVEAVRHWRYSPTLRNGSPVEVLTEVGVHFQLNQ